MSRLPFGYVGEKVYADNQRSQENKSDKKHFEKTNDHCAGNFSCGWQRRAGCVFLTFAGMLYICLYLTFGEGGATASAERNFRGDVFSTVLAVG